MSAHPITGGQITPPPQEFRVRRQQTTVEVETTPLEVEIDNQPTRDAVNLRTPTGLSAQALIEWREAGQEAIDQMVAEGHRLQNLAGGERDVVAHIAEENGRAAGIPHLALASLPAPRVSFTPKTVRLLWKTTEG